MGLRESSGSNFSVRCALVDSLVLPADFAFTVGPKELTRPPGSIRSVGSTYTVGLVLLRCDAPKFRSGLSLGLFGTLFERAPTVKALGEWELRVGGGGECKRDEVGGVRRSSCLRYRGKLGEAMRASGTGEPSGAPLHGAFVCSIRIGKVVEREKQLATSAHAVIPSKLAPSAKAPRTSVVHIAHEYGPKREGAKMKEAL